MEFASVEHSKVSNQLDVDPSGALSQSLDVGDQCVIRKLGRDGKEVRVHAP
jgi:hypothetical protein